MNDSPGGHLTVALEKCGEWSTKDTVFFLNEENDIDNFKSIKKIHEVTNHKSEENLLHAFRNANRLDKDVRKIIKRVVEGCKVCKKFKKSQGKPKVSLPIMTDFNQIAEI